ncbi:HU family DNA-binding protein [Bacteroidota bacterium]
MSIKFYVIEKGQPGVSGGGVKKFYASTKANGEVSLAGLTKSIEKMSTVSGADIRAVLYAMVDVMINELSDGKIVRLGELGSLKVNISSEGRDSSDDVNAKCIKNSKVNFSPGKQIKEMLHNLEYQKI